jgi:hypothetical protein
MRVLLKQCVSNGFDGIKVELGSEVVEDVVARVGVFATFTQRGNRGPVGGCADEDLVDILWRDVSVSSDTNAKRSGERVDEKGTELVLVD